jgi:hypothetical protein
MQRTARYNFLLSEGQQDQVLYYEIKICHSSLLYQYLWLKAYAFFD